MDDVVVWPWLSALCLAAAVVVWVLWRGSRSSRQAGIAAERTRRALAGMSWPEVEQLVGYYFRGRDFTVAEAEHAGPGGAPDLVMTRREEYYLARCRGWRGATVGAEAIREFHRVMAARHAAGGFIVTSGSFSPEARELARERGIELIGAEQLAPLVAGRAAESFSTARR